MPLYQTMWEFMSNHRSEVMVGSNTEGIAKVVKDNGKYAYMMESSSIQYIVERNCKVTQIGGNLDTKVKKDTYINSNRYIIYVINIFLNY